MELRQYVEVIVKRWWLIVVTTMVAAVGSAGISYTTTPVYRSAATLMVDPKSDPYEEAYWTDLNAAATAGAYVVQATSPAVAAQIAARMPVPMTTEEVQRRLAATQIGETGMVEISAQHTDPTLAYTLANTAAQVFVEYVAAQEADRYTGAITELEAQIAELQAQITAARVAIAAFGNAEMLTPAARAELARLQTQVTNDQTRLTVLLNSTEQFRLAIARAGEGLSIFQPAALPEAPSSPRPLRNIALATVVGGMIGVGTAFLLDYLDDTVHTPIDARQTLGVSVLGAIPEVEEANTCAWIAADQPLSPAAEALRDLRTSLQYAGLDAPLRTLLVTSTEPGEGKSFIAANLATTIALAGKRVLLLEGDLRRPKVHHAWHTNRAPGLVDALKEFSETAGLDGSGNATTLAAYTQATPIEGLYLLTAGTRISAPAELLASQTFRRMLETLPDVFDLVVLDAPPILTVTDAAVLASYVDGVLVITASGKTRLPMAARTLERVEAVGGMVLGLVVNRLTARSGGYYYRRYRYGYGYAAESEDLVRESRLGRFFGRIRQGEDALSPGGGDKREVSHTVTLGTFKHEITLPGELIADRELVLTFPVSGSLKAVHVTPGRQVAAGALLAELDAPAEEQALLREESALIIAQLELAKAQTDERITTGNFDLAIARERLKLAEALRAHARERYDRTRLVAPFAGTLLSLTCAPGDAVAAHAPVGVLADVSRFRACARVRVQTLPDGNLHTLFAPGLDADVHVDGDYDLILSGAVAGAADSADSEVGDSEAGGATTVINITLHPGQILPAVAHTAAEITIHGETRTAVPWIPAAALLTADRAEGIAGAGTYVEILTGESVERVAVEPGLIDGDRVEILSGIAAGDTVLLPAPHPGSA